MSVHCNTQYESQWIYLATSYLLWCHNGSWNKNSVHCVIPTKSSIQNGISIATWTQQNLFHCLSQVSAWRYPPTPPPPPPPQKRKRNIIFSSWNLFPPPPIISTDYCLISANVTTSLANPFNGKWTMSDVVKILHCNRFCYGAINKI